jgi:hypothetical protein
MKWSAHTRLPRFRLCTLTCYTSNKLTIKTKTNRQLCVRKPVACVRGSKCSIGSAQCLLRPSQGVVGIFLFNHVSVVFTVLKCILFVISNLFYVTLSFFSQVVWGCVIIHLISRHFFFLEHIRYILLPKVASGTHCSQARRSPLVDCPRIHTKCIILTFS